MRQLSCCAVVLLVMAGVAAVAPADEAVLFDFEDDGDLVDWSPLKLADPKARGAGEPPAKIELSTEGATSGRRALKLTFAGGKYPTVVCTRAPHPEMWFGYKTFRADVTVPRECAVVFRFVYEKTSRKWGWTSNHSRRVKIARCEKGRNAIVDYIRFPGSEKALGKPVTLEIYMLRPRKGESIAIDNIRLSTERPDHTTPFRERNPHYVGEDLGRNARYPWYPMPHKLRILGENLTVTSARRLGDLKKRLWKRPTVTSLEEIEGNWRKLYADIRRTHPGALFAVFRQGDKGFDPKHPEKVFGGWEDCYMLAHDPGHQFERVLGEAPGKQPRTEVFVHRRSTLWRIDLSSIPKGSNILAARFVFAKAYWGKEENWAKLKPGDAYYDFSPLKPTLYIAMPVNRPWVENEASGFEWARDRFWKETCAMSWDGDDPDLLPIVLAYGGTGLNFGEWNFTRLVDYFVNGDRPNWGFTLACPSGYFHNNSVWTSEAPVLKNRPALMVIYESRP